MEVDFSIYECLNCGTIFVTKRCIINPCPICNVREIRRLIYKTD